MAVAVGLIVLTGIREAAWCQEELDVVAQFSLENLTDESELGRQSATNTSATADMTIRNVSTPFVDLYGTLRLGAQVQNERGQRRQGGDIRADFFARTARYTLLLGTDLALSRQSSGLVGGATTQRPRRYQVAMAINQPYWPSLNVTWQRLASTSTTSFGESESRSDRVAFGALYDIEPLTLSFDLTHDQSENLSSGGGGSVGSERSQRVFRASLRESLGPRVAASADFSRSWRDEPTRESGDATLLLAFEYTPTPALALDASRTTVESDVSLPGGRGESTKQADTAFSIRAEPLQNLYLSATRQQSERHATSGASFTDTSFSLNADTQLTQRTALTASLSRSRATFGDASVGRNDSKTLSAAIDHDLPNGAQLSLVAGRSESTSEFEGSATSVETRFLGAQARLEPRPELTVDLSARFGQSDNVLAGAGHRSDFRQLEADLFWEITPDAQLDLRATSGRTASVSLSPETNRFLGNFRWRMSPQTDVLLSFGRDEVNAAQVLPDLGALQRRSSFGVRVTHELSPHTNVEIRYGLSDQSLPVFLRSQDLIVQIGSQL